MSGVTTPPPLPPPWRLRESLGLRAPHTSPSYLRFGFAQVWINPQIAWLSEDFNWAWEGCQSMPGMRGWIKRPRAIVLKGYGEDGEPKERQFEANARKTQDANTQKAPCFQTPHPCLLSICDTQKARNPVFKNRTPTFSPCVSE